MANEACLWCESTKLAEGALSSTGQVYFMAKKSKLWNFKTSMVEVKARVCVDCGYVDLYADTSKLKKLVKS